MNMRIFEVGGSIRNELLGLPANDRDYAVLAPDYQTMKDYLLSRGAVIFQERPEFVSIRAKLAPLGAVDFTLARKEGFYTDGRHPDTTTPAATIEEDLARRDFTMNAIAREVGDTVLIDPFHGCDAIKNKVIQTVGSAEDRFQEDRLRVFRAIRFACQLDFQLSNAIMLAMGRFEPALFGCVSVERIQVELTKAFKANTFKATRLLSDYHNLLHVLIEKGIWLRPTYEKV